MPKRRALIRQLSKAAKARGMTFEVLREGGRHTVFTLDGMRLPIPRHNDINEITAASIRRDAEAKLGKDWWR